jgi:hypothetical protein
MLEVVQQLEMAAGETGVIAEEQDRVDGGALRVTAFLRILSRGRQCSK